MNKCSKCGEDTKNISVLRDGVSMCTPCILSGWGGTMTDVKKHDPINAPSHYFFGDYQTIDIINAWLDNNEVSPREGFFWASMQQYLCRYKKKKGVVDLQKARWYLDELIKINEGGND